jgi:hypothetical protein
VLAALAGHEAHIPASVREPLIGMVRPAASITGPDERELHNHALQILQRWEMEPAELERIYSRLGVPGPAFVPLLRAATPAAIWKEMLSWAAAPEAMRGEALDARHQLLHAAVQHPSLIADAEIRALLAATGDEKTLHHLLTVAPDPEEQQRYFHHLAAADPDGALHHVLRSRSRGVEFPVSSAALSLILAGASPERRMETIRLLHEIHGAGPIPTEGSPARVPHAPAPSLARTH